MPDNSAGGNNETRLLSDERFLRKVAYLYYEDGYSQETIASMEYCSRQTISKALQKAKDRSIVSITIVPDVRTGYLRNLAREVRSHLHLEDLVLVAGRNMNTIAAHQHLDDVIIEIAMAAAEYLDQLLNDTDIVSVGGGTTFLRNVIRYLKPSKVLPHMQVVANIGFVESHTTPGDANLIAYDLAAAYGANHLWFPCPAFLSNSEQLQHVRALPLVKEAYAMMMRANIMMMSLWTPHSNARLIARGILTREQVHAIEAYHPVVDINHWVFDASGTCINIEYTPFPYTLSGLEIPFVRDKIQKHNAKVILVAGGSPSYVPAIRAALRANLANILITDHITAQLLLLDARY